MEREIKKSPADTIKNIKTERKMKKLLSSGELKLVLNQFDRSTFH
ncbi:hypothetical protein J2S05_003774 [Alkalicoccobacillus murimartini]|uniref:Uncharacterized protein n=1 Tax=Alkalicoccobacillus murimartini TaxID=171685 RepID=A0ABT9YN89_9BACI|nr:hypothetical protein [Alkalicoccobacillus murimartini]